MSNAIHVTRHPFKVEVVDPAKVPAKARPQVEHKSEAPKAYKTSLPPGKGLKVKPSPKKASPYVYAQGDKAKVPVDVRQQPAGTKLIQVTEMGREVPFVVGKATVKSLADRKASLASKKSGKREG